MYKIQFVKNCHIPKQYKEFYCKYMFSPKYLEMTETNCYLITSEKGEEFNFSEFFFNDLDDSVPLNPRILKHHCP